MNTKLRTEAKNNFENDFFKLMNNSVFEKTTENVRNHRDIKLVTTDERREKLVSEPNYHPTKWFNKEFLATEINKRKILMNKRVYLGQEILDVSKTFMYELWYGYLKPKYGEKVKLCYMDTDIFNIHVETEDFYKYIANDVDKWFDTSAYDKNDNRPLPIGKNKNVIAKFKDELNGKIMTKLCFPASKRYEFLLDDNDECKKAKGTKKCVIKKYLNLRIIKSQYLKRKL